MASGLSERIVSNRDLRLSLPLFHSHPHASAPPQLWFDDEASLSAKYELAGGLGIHGVAIWTADMLPYGEPAHGARAASMWAALRQNFTGGAAPALHVSSTLSQ